MTVQMSETLLWNDWRFPLFSTPLDGCDLWPEEEWPRFRSAHTANHRGYHGTWAIKDRRLYLVELGGNLEGNSQGTLETLLPNHRSPIFAEWVNGDLRLGGGAYNRHSHTRYGAKFRDNIRLQFENGHLRSMDPGRNKEWVGGEPVLYQYVGSFDQPDEYAWKSGQPKTFDMHMGYALHSCVIELRIRHFSPGREYRSLPSLLEPFDITIDFSGIYCPMKEVLAFFDTIASGADHAEVQWDPEGTEGRLIWRKGQDSGNIGALTIEWAPKGERTKVYALRAHGADVALMFYSAFRRFVDNPLYDPFRYEGLRGGEMIRSLVLDVTSTEILQAMSRLTLVELEKLMRAFEQVDSERQMKGTLRAKRLEEYLCEITALPEYEPALNESAEAERVEDPISPFTEDWDWQDPEMREARLRAWAAIDICAGWRAARLTEMRCPAIEQLMKYPWPCDDDNEADDNQHPRSSSKLRSFIESL